jgi:hypothetical protein
MLLVVMEVVEFIYNFLLESSYDFIYDFTYITLTFIDVKYLPDAIVPRA